MSEEDKRQEQHQNSNYHNITNEGEGDTSRKEPTAQRLSNRTARVGALVLQAYQGRKGGTSPNKLLFSCITKLVRTGNRGVTEYPVLGTNDVSAHLLVSQPSSGKLYPSR